MVSYSHIPKGTIFLMKEKGLTPQYAILLNDMSPNSTGTAENFYQTMENRAGIPGWDWQQIQVKSNDKNEIYSKKSKLEKLTEQDLEKLTREHSIITTASKNIQEHGNNWADDEYWN